MWEYLLTSRREGIRIISSHSLNYSPDKMEASEYANRNTNERQVPMTTDRENKVPKEINRNRMEKPLRKPESFLTKRNDSQRECGWGSFGRLRRSVSFPNTGLLNRQWSSSACDSNDTNMTDAETRTCSEISRISRIKRSTMTMTMVLHSLAKCQSINSKRTICQSNGARNC